jgi:hypothetical protein
LLISSEAISRTEAHSEVPVEDHSKWLSTMIASERLAVSVGVAEVHNDRP